MHEELALMEETRKLLPRGFYEMFQTRALMEDRFERHLNSLLPRIALGARTYGHGELLRRVDPDAFQTEFYSWLDSGLARSDWHQMAERFLSNDHLIEICDALCMEYDREAMEAGA
jgi:hypothetical protein